MQILGILWPTFALVLVIFAVWLTLVWQRLGHMKRTPPGAGDFASGDAAARYFEPVAMPADNLANLFEMPVLYFALVPLLIATRTAGDVQVTLAWVYVVLRGVHSIVHIGPRKVPLRFLAYFASCAVLAAMWIGFFVDAQHAAHLLARAQDVTTVAR